MVFEIYWLKALNVVMRRWREVGSLRLLRFGFWDILCDIEVKYSDSFIHVGSVNNNADWRLAFLKFPKVPIGTLPPRLVTCFGTLSLH